MLLNRLPFCECLLSVLGKYFRVHRVKNGYLAVIGYSSRSDRDKVYYYHLPTIVKHQGEQMLSITTKQCCAWLKAISRDDLTGDKLSIVFVYEEHFVHGKKCRKYFISDIIYV